MATEPASELDVAVDVDAYLGRLGMTRRPARDLESLVALQRAHLTTVPFENLDLVFAGGVPHDLGRAVDKVVARRRGGWCFEVNGAFAVLLQALGFEVRLLAAAVLLTGPSDVVEHLALEVDAGEPYLVDVGFGDSFVRPLALNDPRVLDGGDAPYQLLPSPKGTTLVRLVDEVPSPLYRFTRVAHAFDDFAPAARMLQSDTDRYWTRKPFATRLLDGGPDRVTLSRDRLRVRRNGVDTDTPVDLAAEPEAWGAVLAEWFDMSIPGR